MRERLSQIMNMSNKEVITFTEVVTPHRTSIAADIPDGSERGIYVYGFTDGTWYVGKSTDVRRRHAQHIHEYEKETPPLVIEKMHWAPLERDDVSLDLAEAQTIAAMERKGFSLRNIMLTGRPRGNGPAIVSSGAAQGIVIPWQRENRPTSGVSFSYEENPAMLSKFKKFASLPKAAEILHILQTYVKETVPAPSESAGKLWVATALPSTSTGTRRCCISVQNAETLVIYEERRWGKDVLCGFINVKRREDGQLPRGVKMTSGDYGTLPECITLHFRTLEKMTRALKDNVVLDCCYRANSELMRRGPSMYRRFNNPYLTEAILG